MKIFDSQVAWGRNIFGPDSDIETYISNATAMGIYKVLLLPTGTHELVLPDGSIEKSCLWYSENSRIIHKRILQIPDGKIKEEINPINPYQAMNDKTLATVQKLNSEQEKIRFYFAPKLHPQLDTREEVQRLIQNKEAIGFKIQTLSSYTTTYDIPEWLAQISRTSNLPFMIHTDYIDTNDSSTAPEMRYIMEQSHPLNWINWAKGKDVRMFLAHGLRLDPESSAIVNNSRRFIVGLGPDLLLQTEQSRLVTKTNDYLTKLFELVDEDKITFNTDYRWNVQNRNNWNILDWQTPKRIIEFAEKHGLKDDFLEKILFRNGEQFFNIEE